MIKSKQPKVYQLTQEGKENLEHEIVLLELKHREIQQEIGLYINDNPLREDFVDSALSELRAKSKTILKEAKRKARILNSAKIVEAVESIDTVQLGSFIRLNLTYDSEQGIEQEMGYVVELTGNAEADYGYEIDQISKESPLGENIFNKKVGERVEFFIPASNIECACEIVEIIKGLENRKKVLVK